MSHPEFFELTFDGRQAACQAGLQRVASPLPGAWGCAPLLFPSRAACGGARKKGKKGFSGNPRTPAEGGYPLHSRFFEFLFQKFGMTHGVCSAHTILNDTLGMGILNICLFGC